MPTVKEINKAIGGDTLAVARAQAASDPKYTAVMKTRLDSFFQDFSATMDHLEETAKQWKKGARKKRKA